MMLPRFLFVLVLGNAFGGVLSCGGGSPPPPCSWTTCINVWRDDWAPGISTGRCVEQQRRANQRVNQHHGAGSCPAPEPCYPVGPQNRVMCKYDSWSAPSAQRVNFNCKSSAYIQTSQRNTFAFDQLYSDCLFFFTSIFSSLETTKLLMEIQSSTFFEQIGNLTLKIMILIGTDLDQIGYHEQSMLFCHKNGNHTLSAHKLFFFFFKMKKELH